MLATHGQPSPTTADDRVGFQSANAATRRRTLHQLRHSRLTHLAESGVQLPILMGKSRHTSLTSLGVYAKPTFDAVAAVTAALDPDRRR